MFCQLKKGLTLATLAMLVVVLGCSKNEPESKKSTPKTPAPKKSEGAESKTATTGPNFSDVNWTALAQVDFTGNDKKDATFLWDVPGVAWEIADDACRVKGTTTEDGWKGTRINIPVTKDEGDIIEVSGEFKVAQGDGHHLVALFGQDGKPHAESLCMLFEREDGKGEYRIQTEWAQHSAKLVEGSKSIQAFGDESERFHKMRMVLDRSAKKVYYFVDEVHLGTVEVDGTVAPIVNLQMDFESSKAGTNIEIIYDNLIARSGTR